MHGCEEAVLAQITREGSEVMCRCHWQDVKGRVRTGERDHHVRDKISLLQRSIIVSLSYSALRLGQREFRIAYTHSYRVLETERCYPAFSSSQIRYGYGS